MRKGFILLTFLLTFGILPASAQMEDSPLLHMLAQIPDGSSATEYLTYVDYRALVAAHPDAPTVTSLADYQAVAADSSQRSALIGALNELTSGPQFYGQSFAQADGMPNAVGFDLFSIERAVEYGNPPNTVDLLEGNFDAAAVAAAHEQHGYTQSKVSGLTILCPEAGCDSGNQLDLKNRNPANPFGGQLGRSQPVLLGDHLIASSTSDTALMDVASTIAGDGSSLADNREYRAAAEAISADKTVLQAYFVNPSDIAPASTAAIDPSLSPTEAAALMQTLQDSFVPLPQYNVVALADATTATERQVLVALVYTNHTDAAAAAALFPDHLEQAQSLRTQRSFGDLLTDRGVTSLDAAVYTASTNRSVMLLTLHAPLPASGDEAQTRSAFALLAQAYMSRDLGWLATQF